MVSDSSETTRAHRVRVRLRGPPWPADEELDEAEWNIDRGGTGSGGTRFGYHRRLRGGGERGGRACGDSGDGRGGNKNSDHSTMHDKPFKGQTERS
ncbi:hypothetical protein ASD42_27995 [Nocardia sp. Root136]|nr:hypothetical protein ASD42_27995 [Nocardia sp. Root136]